MEELIAADIRLVNAVQRITTPIESPDISLAPVVFFIWPDLPQWIAYIFPTHYFMKPLYEVAIKGADLVTVLPLLGVALALCVALLPVIFGSGRRLQAGLASA